MASHSERFEEGVVTLIALGCVVGAAWGIWKVLLWLWPILVDAWNEHAGLFTTIALYGAVFIVAAYVIGYLETDAPDRISDWAGWDDE